MLFGNEHELRDFKRVDLSSTCDLLNQPIELSFCIVPVTRQEFNMLADFDFLNLIQIFGVKLPKGQNVYPRITSIKSKTFKEQLD